jgi:hypothetical protein
MSEPVQIRTPEELVAVLKSNPDRNVYEGADGGYYVTWQGGQTTRRVIDLSEKLGMIKRRYPDKKLNAWDLLIR